MSFQKWFLAAMALCITASVAIADPMRTVFTKENKFPEAMGWEVSLGGGATSYKDNGSAGDIDTSFIAPAARFGVTERLALTAEIPMVGYSSDAMDEFGLGDISLGAEFLFWEDIFEYAWIIPHADISLATGDEDKGLGNGKSQASFGISIGTTVNDVVHFAADGTYMSNGKIDTDGEYDGLGVGALSIVWDLDERASVLGEVQVRDDTVGDASYGTLAHLGMSYRINDGFTLMVYGGGGSDLAIDSYGMGRLVYQF